MVKDHCQLFMCIVVYVYKLVNGGWVIAQCAANALISAGRIKVYHFQLRGWW